MDVQDNNLTKLCSFYVSDWHLVTMLLPYINKKINEQAQIATILENNVEENYNKWNKRLYYKTKYKITKIYTKE